ncbi:hypothetical protein BDY21DRAFT_16066 [Lineolata rhizophorae]|uniref:Uncharacterized protein n=1 Tax=Lineolata rhizophorae TaxID=578093 RepID=A0A6A6P1H7_9PEZI|nr:hypothetical protein BDY21DRAFT_16066 [Lineolata rhizophorae]
MPCLNPVRRGNVVDLPGHSHNPRTASTWKEALQRVNAIRYHTTALEQLMRIPYIIPVAKLPHPTIRGPEELARQRRRARGSAEFCSTTSGQHSHTLARLNRHEIDAGPGPVTCTSRAEHLIDAKCAELYCPHLHRSCIMVCALTSECSVLAMFAIFNSELHLQRTDLSDYPSFSGTSRLRRQACASILESGEVLLDCL